MDDGRDGRHLVRLQHRYPASEQVPAHELRLPVFDPSDALPHDGLFGAQLRRHSCDEGGPIAELEVKGSVSQDLRAQCCFLLLRRFHSFAVSTASPSFVFQCFANVLRKRIIRIWSTQKCLNAQQYCPDLKGWTPFVFQNIEAYPPKLVNVRMIYFCQETDLWRCHWIFFRRSTDSRSWFAEKPLRLLDHSSRKITVRHQISYSSLESWRTPEVEDSEALSLSLCVKIRS
ncbi:hypothetical protein ACFX12_029765 [Malus domestica]